MSAQDLNTHEVPPPLGARLAEGATAAQVAEAVGNIWLEIDQALHPIIGRRGVAALYSRSLKLTAATYPWLTPGYQSALFAVDPAALKSSLAKQTAGDAAAGGSALFQSFHDLLVSLIGASLTDRLLRAVWAPPSGAPLAQDTNS